MPTQAPIEVAVTVECPAPEAFTLFVDRLADWWPLQDYSIARDGILAVEVDRRVGGRVEEVHASGGRALWGTLTVWEPGRRFAMTWEVTSGMEETIVEITFQPVTPSVTRVRLVHSGWEGLEPSVIARMSGYDAGWQKILGCFADSVRGRVIS
jgi:uncharacterized protein YndB with AHSA1/START domain